MENESFSADIHDAFGSFMLQCSSLFHPSKSLRNKNEAKLLRYFLFLSSFFIKPRDLHLHTLVEKWRHHTDSTAPFLTIQHKPKTITLRSGLAERELILKENTITTAFHIIPTTLIHRWELLQRWIKHLQTSLFKHKQRLLIYFYHSNGSCKH